MMIQRILNIVAAASAAQGMVARGRQAAGPCANPGQACEPLTIDNVGGGCSVDVAFVPDPFQQSFTFSDASRTFNARNAQNFSLNAQPLSAAFGAPTWTGTDTPNNPTTFHTDPRSNGQTISVTCPPALPTITLQGSGEGCTSFTAQVGGDPVINLPPQGGAFQAAPGSVVTLNAQTSASNIYPLWSGTSSQISISTTYTVTDANSQTIAADCLSLTGYWVNNFCSDDVTVVDASNTLPTTDCAPGASCGQYALGTGETVLLSSQGTSICVTTAFAGNLGCGNQVEYQMIPQDAVSVTC